MKIAFTGDVSFTGGFASCIHENKEVFDEKILSYFNKHDYTLVNLEGPVTNSNNFIKDDGLVVSPRNTILYLKSRNISLFNCANNHMFDAGLRGFLDTKREIETNGCLYFGAGNNIEEASEIKIVEKDDIRVSFICFAHFEGMIASSKNAGVLYIGKRLKLLKGLIKRARSLSDYVVLCYHGGEEFTRIPMPSRRRYLRRIANLDVDLVLAHHSHVFQGIEFYNGKYIFYSLGNFVFDIPPYRNKRFNDESAILSIEFSKNNPIKYELFPVHIDINNNFIWSSINKELALKSYTDISNFNNYWSLWFKDSYQAFFFSDLDKASIKQENGSDQLKRKKSIFHVIRVGFSLLRKRNKRELFISSVLFLIYKKITSFIR